MGLYLPDSPGMNFENPTKLVPKGSVPTSLRRLYCRQIICQRSVADVSKDFFNEANMPAKLCTNRWNMLHKPRDGRVSVKLVGCSSLCIAPIIRVDTSR